MKPPLTITDRDEYQAKIMKAADILYQVAKSAYGPAAGNVVLGFKHGPPMLSRDGVTNIKQVRDKDPFVDDVIQAIKEVSEKNNQKVGDGTTGVVILAHPLLETARKLESKGVNPMQIAEELKEAEKIALDYIESVKKPISDELLVKVATISANDENLGMMIADIMKEVGKDGGVMIEQYEGLGVHNELIDGFYFHKGYKDTDLINDVSLNQSDHKDIPVLVSSKVFATNVDIAPVLQTLKSKGISEFIFIAEVRDEALESLKMAKKSGVIFGVPIDPPYVAGGRTLFLEDIATMIGSEVFNGDNRLFDPAKHLGHAREVLVTEHSTTILEGDSDPKLLKERIASLRKQLKEESHPQSIQFIKDRLARLTNKMAIIKVGGAIEFERDEVKLRIQDAVCAVQSAMKDGVVPGGGTTLARIQGTPGFDDAFKQPFRQLVENAGRNKEALLAKVENSDAWYGFNIKGTHEEPVDLMEAGILDASLVVKEIVINAIALVRGLITAGAALAYEEKQ